MHLPVVFNVFFLQFYLYNEHSFLCDQRYHSSIVHNPHYDFRPLEHYCCLSHRFRMMYLSIWKPAQGTVIKEQHRPGLQRDRRATRKDLVPWFRGSCRAQGKPLEPSRRMRGRPSSRLASYYTMDGVHARLQPWSSSHCVRIGKMSLNHLSHFIRWLSSCTLVFTVYRVW